MGNINSTPSRSSVAKQQTKLSRNSEPVSGSSHHHSRIPLPATRSSHVHVPLIRSPRANFHILSRHRQPPVSFSAPQLSLPRSDATDPSPQPDSHLPKSSPTPSSPIMTSHHSSATPKRTSAPSSPSRHRRPPPRARTPTRPSLHHGVKPSLTSPVARSQPDPLQTRCAAGRPAVTRP